MKKLATLLTFVLLLPLAACAESFKEGDHYQVVADRVSAEPEVMEMFSYWCPHCYTFEPIAQEIKKSLPKGASFRKVHVDFLGFASKPLQQDLTRAMYAAQTLKVSDKANKAIFEYIHKQRAKITNVNDVRRILMVQGIAGEDFDKAMKSFAVNGMFKKNQKEIEKYLGKVNGVPAFIVNGKYKVVTSKLRSTEEMIKLVQFLLKKKD